jgi:hypothetical protein
MEPQIFRCRFSSWDEVLSVDFTQTPETLEKKAIEKVCIMLFPVLQFG